MRNFLTKNRWAVIVAGIIIWTSTSLPVLWGVFQAPAAESYGITLAESAMIFPMCNMFFGMFSIIGGRLQDKFRPNIVATIGAIVMSTGVFMLSFLAGGTSVTKLYICFALPFGAGCGFIAPTLSASLMKWYADKKGFAAGVAGAVPSIILVGLTYVSKYLLGIWDIKRIFFVYGMIILVVTVSSTMILVNPTDEYIMEKASIAVLSTNKSDKPVTNRLVDFAPSEMLRTKQFWMLFLAMVVATPSYMLIAPSIVTLGISRGLSENLAVSAVAIATGVSAIGKFIIPTLSDKIGRKRSAVIFASFTTLFSVILMGARGVALLASYSAMVFTHNGLFALMGPFVIDLFGSKNAGTNMGLMSVQATIASLACSATLAYLVPLFGPLTNHVVSIAGIAIAVVLISLLDVNTAKLKEK